MQVKLKQIIIILGFLFSLNLLSNIVYGEENPAEIGAEEEDNGICDPQDEPFGAEVDADKAQNWWNNDIFNAFYNIWTETPKLASTTVNNLREPFVNIYNVMVGTPTPVPVPKPTPAPPYHVPVPSSPPTQDHVPVPEMMPTPGPVLVVPTVPTTVPAPVPSSPPTQDHVPTPTPTPAPAPAPTVPIQAGANVTIVNAEEEVNQITNEEFMDNIIRPSLIRSKNALKNKTSSRNTNIKLHSLFISNDALSR